MVTFTYNLDDERQRDTFIKDIIAEQPENDRRTAQLEELLTLTDDLEKERDKLEADLDEANGYLENDGELEEALDTIAELKEEIFKLKEGKK